MARVNIKYPIGTKVKVISGGEVEGMVTAVFIRGGNRSYEFSYIDNNGNPTSNTVDEVEIKPRNESRLGFNH